MKVQDKLNDELWTFCEMQPMLSLGWRSTNITHKNHSIPCVSAIMSITRSTVTSLDLLGLGEGTCPNVSNANLCAQHLATDQVNNTLVYCFLSVIHSSGYLQYATKAFDPRLTRAKIQNVDCLRVYMWKAIMVCTSVRLLCQFMRTWFYLSHLHQRCDKGKAFWLGSTWKGNYLIWYSSRYPS